MAEADLRLLLRTIADTSGAEKTSQALRRVQQDAAQTGTQSQRLGTATTNLSQSFGASTTGALRFATSLGSIGIAGLSVGAGVALLADRIGTAAEAFSASQRVARATAAAYGSSAAEFTRFATQLSAQTGFSSNAILEAALSARTLSANYGLATAQTQQLIRVSADLANVRGIGIAEAFERVQSAIRGEAEASEFLGLTLNDTFIKNNALNGSVRRTFETMTDAEKAQIRYNEVLRQTAQFSGLAASGAESLEGAQRKAARASDELGKTVGSLVAPALRDAAVAQASWTDALAKWLAQYGRLPTDQEQRARAAAQAQALPQIGPQAVNRVAGSDLIGPKAGQSATDALNESLKKLGVTTQDQTKKERDLAAERQRQRLLEQNANRQVLGDRTAELAYLDQQREAVRELTDAQRELTSIQSEANRLRGEEARAVLDVLPARQEQARLEREIANVVNRRVQLELESRRIAAERAAAPATQALEDTERALERARLVSADLTQPREERVAALRESIALRRNLNRQRLEAFDAESAVRTVDRQQRAFDLDTRARQIPLEQRRADVADAARGREDALLRVQQAVERQEALANVSAARVDEQGRVLAEVLRQGIDAGFVKARITIPVQVNVQMPDGTTVTYEEQVEAVGQAQMPPVIQVSGVRR